LCFKEIVNIIHAQNIVTNHSRLGKSQPLSYTIYPL
jgi:hypothetical protein